MPTGLHWTGVESLISGLTSIAAEYKRDAQQDAAAAARAHAGAMTRVYQAHRKTGALAASVTITTTQNGMRIEATAPHAKYAEYGTRYMAAFGVFQSAGVQAGRAMQAAAERRVSAPKTLR